MSTNNWPLFLRTISLSASGAEISKITGVSESTVSRWLSGDTMPRPQQAVEVTRAYGFHPLNGLRAAGYLEETDDLLDQAVPQEIRLSQFNDLELAREIVRRIEERGSETLDAPLDDHHPALQRDNVTPLRKTLAEELGAVAKPENAVIEIDEFDQD